MLIPRAVERAARGVSRTLALVLPLLAGCPCTEVRTGTLTIPDDDVWVHVKPWGLRDCPSLCDAAGIKRVTACRITGWSDDSDTADSGGYDFPAATIECTGAWPSECPS